MAEPPAILLACYLLMTLQIPPLRVPGLMEERWLGGLLEFMPGNSGGCCNRKPERVCIGRDYGGSEKNGS